MRVKIKQGENVEEEFCPKCQERLTIQMKDGDVEVFECKNCKFKVEKKE
jgi:Zn ribbon nucleic-acid-binding protein